MDSRFARAQPRRGIAPTANLERTLGEENDDTERQRDDRECLNQRDAEQGACKDRTTCFRLAGNAFDVLAHDKAVADTRTNSRQAQQECDGDVVNRFYQIQLHVKISSLVAVNGMNCANTAHIVQITSRFARLYHLTYGYACPNRRG